jgi:hypothetical protein
VSPACPEPSNLGTRHRSSAATWRRQLELGRPAQSRTQRRWTSFVPKRLAAAGRASSDLSAAWRTLNEPARRIN